MILSKQTVEKIGASGLSLPDRRLFDLPEKVLQFGTGVFLRGLIDYFVDKANKEGTFGGRVVMVKSTASGDSLAFAKQDCLYTLVMKSLEEGKVTDERIVCAALSRLIDANDDWNAVLACAANPEISIIISNTTEAGIVFDGDDATREGTPGSFPGKLLAVLERRFNSLGGSMDTGFVIVPTELIPDNATKLKAIVNQLANLKKTPPGFLEWLNTANDFCNSLVDRIVPGKLPGPVHEQVEKELGFEDELMIMAEPFGLWAIETNSVRSKEILSFSKSHEGIHLVENIDKFRELKLRLLNGSHNLSCALGFLAGFPTVREAMANPEFDHYMRRLILDDIAAAIRSETISAKDAQDFGSSVLERYRNPFIEFQWLSICVQDTTKIRVRCIPIITQHYRKYGYVPDAIALGMAAYILFMKCAPSEAGNYVGKAGDVTYPINDDYAANLSEKWRLYKGLELVQAVLNDQTLWETDLSGLLGFAENVNFYLDNLMTQGFFKTVDLRHHSTA